MSQYFVLKPFIKPSFSGLVFKTEKRPVEEARGATLSGDAVAEGDVPPYDMALRDGWAVSSADEGARTPDEGGVMNGVEPGPLEPGHARWINTGGMLPRGSDAVVPAADARDPLPADVRVEPEQFVLRRGADRHRGEIVLPSGTLLGARESAMLLEAGIREVAVSVAPKVLILSTGTEISTASANPAACRRAGNGAYVHSLLEGMGIESRVVHVRDDVPEIVAALRDRGECGLIISIGGTGRGTHDLMRDALTRAGGILEDLAVSSHAAPPFIWARLDGVPVLGLPGHPLGALMITQRVLLPFLSKVYGVMVPGAGLMRAVLGEDVETESDGELCVSLSGDVVPVATPIRKGTCRTGVFAKAGGVVWVQAGRLEAGTEVLVEPFVN